MYNESVVRHDQGERRQGDHMELFAGFVTFIGVSVGARLALEWALDTWWSSQGLDPSSRPPFNALVEWLVAGGIGLGAAWFVTRAFGED